MLLWNLYLLFEDPLLFFLLVGLVSVALLAAITVHEFSHALVADRLGDDTPRRAGRLSLNPRAHLDPVGTLMLFAVGFGWGKPVPVNPYRLGREPRMGMGLVAFAGPLSNLVLAGLVALPARMGLVSWHPPLVLPGDITPAWLLSALVSYVILFSLILAVFNLIPVAPLDGFKVAVGVLPRDLAYSYAQTERYGPMILLLVLAFGYVTGFLGTFLTRAVNFLALLLVGRGL